MTSIDGVIMVAWKRPGVKPRYMVLRRTKNWEGWELPKGHLEDDVKQTVKKELEEEAGVSEDEIEKIEDMEEDITWTVENDRDEEEERDYRAFAVKVSDMATVDVSRNPDDEHSQGFFLNFEDTRELLTYDNHRELLEEANSVLE